MAAGGIGGVLAYAGAVCYLVHGATNQEAEVDVYTWDPPANVGGQRTPFGFLMQKVKTGYHQVHPTGFVMPGDLGSSDAIAQPKYNTTGTITGTKPVPVGVAHLGIWDTVHYTGSTAMFPGQNLTVNTGTSGSPATYGRVTNGATTLDGVTTTVARVIKGASAAKVAANIANTTLYPIRIKLLI